MEEDSLQTDRLDNVTEATGAILVEVEDEEEIRTVDAAAMGQIRTRLAAMDHRNAD